MKGRRPKLTNQQQHELAQKYRAGAGSLQLAREFGVCYQTVLNVIRRLGLTPHPVGRKGRRPKLTNQQQHELAQKYRAGAGSLQLAREFGVCCQTVLNVIRRLGLTPHPVGRRAAARTWNARHMKPRRRR